LLSLLSQTFLPSQHGELTGLNHKSGDSEPVIQNRWFRTGGSTWSVKELHEVTLTPCLPSPRGVRGRVRTVLLLKGTSLTPRPSAHITKPFPFTHFVTPRGSADLLGGRRPPSLFSFLIINSSPLLGQPSVPGLATFFIRLLLTPFRPAGARRFPGSGWLRGPKLSKHVGGETCVLRPAVGMFCLAELRIGKQAPGDECQPTVSPTVSPFFGSASMIPRIGSCGVTFTILSAGPRPAGLNERTRERAPTHARARVFGPPQKSKTHSFLLGPNGRRRCCLSYERPELHRDPGGETPVNK
jgi:hypothetical protein